MPAAPKRLTFHNSLGSSIHPLTLLSLFTWFIPLLIPPCFSADITFTQRCSEEDFANLQCNGTYSFKTFLKLQDVCEDCYYYFHEPSIYSLCRQPCFTSIEFRGCAETLQMQDEMITLIALVKELAGS